MKQLKQWTMIGLLILAPLCLVSCETGCSSLNRTAYQVTGTTVVSVDAAMNVWGAYVKANHPGPEAEKKVKDAYEKYQQSVVMVTDAAIAMKKDPSLKLNLDTLMAIASKALLDLENIIVGITGKPL